VWPQVAGVLVGSLASRDAERLAGISGSDATRLSSFVA